MINYAERIKENSTWYITTPTQTALKMPLYALEAGHFYAYSDYRVSRDYHDSYLLILTLRGQGFVGDEILSEKEAKIIDCHKPHSYGSINSEWEFLWIHFSGVSAPGLFEIFNDSISSKFKTDDEYKALLLRLLTNFHFQDTLNLLNVSQSLEKLFMLTMHSELTLSKESVDVAINYISAHYSDNITVDFLSNYVNLSKYHFIRQFKKSIGISPYAYLTNFRINEAKRMLIESDRSVDDIAHLSGFLDTANFIRQFKLHTGLTPLQYRKSGAAMVSL